ncbi:MAG: hypothetical protein ACFBSC_22165 [Microcoleaceae cyanobacterium]
MTQLTRLFLDTNVYILGAADRQSPEGLILDWVGFWDRATHSVEIVISEELLDQISRVAKRLKNKDWSGELIGRIWQNLNLHYTTIDNKAFSELEAQSNIPREDIGIYLTARTGEAECFISANHKLIRNLVETTQEFICLTPEEFVQSYLQG